PGARAAHRHRVRHLQLDLQRRAASGRVAEAPAAALTCSGARYPRPPALAGNRRVGPSVPAGKVNPRTPDMPTWPIASIKELLEPTINHMGYELYSIDQSGQSGRTLRISIDHNDPITIEDCERVSRVAGPLLDHANLINGRYDLEVSSPGAERPLRGRDDYARFHGKRVNIRYRSGEA